MSTEPTSPRRSAALVEYPDSGYYTPKPSRVDWRPLSRQLDLSGRSAKHSGRPSIEFVPRLNTPSLKRLMADQDSVLATLRADDGPLAVMTHIRAKFRDDGGSLRLTWNHTPETGAAVTYNVDVRLVAVHRPLGTAYHASCPHCDRRVHHLYWAVSTWGCRACLGIASEQARQPTYTTERFVKRARAALGQPQGAFQPIILGKGVSRRRRQLAQRLYEAESRVIADALSGKNR